MARVAVDNTTIERTTKVALGFICSLLTVFYAPPLILAGFLFCRFCCFRPSVQNARTENVCDDSAGLDPR